MRPQGVADHLVSEAIYLADPDGNGIELYRDRPRAEWLYDDGNIRTNHRTRWTWTAACRADYP